MSLAALTLVLAVSMDAEPNQFPQDFVWGVATAAPQIEGGAFEDGKGESIWDRYSRIPGRVDNGDTLDVACDHYHRYREDIALMRDLGVKHYRLSIAWPRVIPDGSGGINQRGIDYYRRLFDAMHDAGVTPWVTLFHWDLPQVLEDRGGWVNPATVGAFARYADTVVAAFHDRVKNWITLNEIRCFTYLAYGHGRKAPDRAVSDRELNQTYHHALLCHGHGVRAVREHGGRGARVGLTDNSDVCIPVSETPMDIHAAKKWFEQRNDHLLGAVCRGGYSERYLAQCGEDAPRVDPGDFRLIGAPTDFLGLNLYTGTFVRARKDGTPEELAFPVNYPRADSAWLRLTPQVMYWGTRLARDVYGVESIYITENGCGYDDEPVINGEVIDLHRRDYLRAHLREVRRAIQHGVPINGYFVWSFMDNFEWEDGYRRRFGIVHVDFRTQARTPKLSARYYGQAIAGNRIP